MRLTIFFALLIALFLSSCIKQVTLNLRATAPQLVVEGLLLTDSTPCKVTLSYSGIFNSFGAQAQNFIDDATVYVKNNAGDSTQLFNMGSGQYISTTNVNAKAGGSYYISIALSNGKRYASIPETIAPVPQVITIDSIGEVALGGATAPNGITSQYGLYGAQIQIKTKDPANEKNYYRWVSTDWLARKATGITGPACANTGQMVCFQTCSQFYQDNNVYILSDANINGTDIRYQTALVAPYYYYGNHYISIKQLSLTQQAYQFWLLFNQQTTRTGSILDPLPSPLQGNIYNIHDSTDLAVGYFEASDVVSLKFTISPFFLNAYLTLANAPQYVATGACYLVYTPAYTFAPPGWENAPNYIVYVY